MNGPRNRKSFKKKFILSSVGIFIIAFVIPFIFFTIAQINTTIDDEMELKNQILVDRCHILNIQIRNNLEECENTFSIIRQFHPIQEFVGWRASNDTLDDEFALLSPSEQVEGSFYTEKLNSTSLYQDVLQYFLSISSERPSLEMLRVFWADGNLLVGIMEGDENLVDYKGDKSWFQDTLQMSDHEEIYISPISIARQTNTTAIRIAFPLVVGNETVGILVANMGMDYILAPIFDIPKYSYETPGIFSSFLDLNYENAEGIEIGEIYIAKSGQPDLEINETTAGAIEFKAEMFEDANSSSSEITHGPNSVMIDGIM